METKQHALLSPSASHRWLNCTASPRLEELCEDNGSDYAREGSLAHAMAAKTLKAELGQSTEGEEAEIAELYDQYHTGEMDEHVSTYCAIVRETLAMHRQKLAHSKLMVEVRLDFSDWVPESFGTSDAIVVGDGALEVVDLKYGKGVPVDAKDNSQMMIYALGALDRFGDDYDIKTVRMTIVQPRLAALSSWEICVDDLLQWAEVTLKPKAAEAYAGGTAKAGEWCRFCKVKGQCRMLTETVTSGNYDTPTELMTEAQVAEALSRIPMIKQWAAAVEEHALKLALSGVTIPGYKIVAGRSVRKIVNTGAALLALMNAGYESTEVVKSELRGITDLEKLVGKKKLATLIGEYIQKPEGKPTLVEESDKREALDPRAALFYNIDI